MGCFSGSKERGMNVDDDFGGPVKQRTCTDVTFLIIKILFTVGLLGLVGYCFAYGSLPRLFRGYDNCGNICGVVNAKAKMPNFDCKGGDFTAKKYLKYESIKGKAIFDVKNTKRECVANCTAFPGYVPIFNKCLPLNVSESRETVRTSVRTSIRGNLPLAEALKNITLKPVKKKNNTENTINFGDFFEEVADDLGNIWPQLIYICLIAFALSLFFLLMFRYAAPVMVWTSLVLIIALTAGWATYLWVTYSKIDTSTKRGSEKAHNRMIQAILMTVVAVIVLLIILVMRKRIRLVIQLFEEAARAAAAMPLIFIQPIWTFLALAVSLTLFVSFALVVQSAGKLTHVNDGPDPPYYYKKDMAMKVTRWYNLFAIFWFSQFVISCQHMVVAGAVSSWYFTRDKSRLGSPIWTGLTNLVRFHLGSVLLGSLVMAIIAFIKFLLKLAERAVKESDNAFMKVAYCCFRCLMDCVERIFNMISRNAYVEIAIYGKGFCPSAMRGLKVLFNNVFSVAAINSVGDFVLFIIKFLIVIITLIFSSLIILNKENIHYPWLPIILSVIFTFFIAHTFISVFEMIIDTIFICFCEDCEMNDGINKPYFMNRGLMEFVENSKRVLKIKDNQPNDNQPSAPPM